MYLGQEILDRAFEGYNACIFAYGQTGLLLSAYILISSFYPVFYDNDSTVGQLICTYIFVTNNTVCLSSGDLFETSLLFQCLSVLIHCFCSILTLAISGIYFYPWALLYIWA